MFHGLFRRVVTARQHIAGVSRPTKLQVEVLEGREVPTTFTWVGGTPGQEHNWSVPSNWVGGLPYEVPGPGDGLVFSGQVSSLDCTLGNVYPNFQSVSMVEKYQGTVTTAGTDANDFVQSCGVLSISSYGQFRVHDSWEWTGGTIDGTEYEQLRVTEGAAGVVIPPTDGLITNASIYVGDGFYQTGETLEFRAGEVLFGGNATLNSSGTAVVTLLPAVVLAKDDQTKMLAYNGPGSTHRVTQGGSPVFYKGKVTNEGTILLQNKANAEFLGGAADDFSLVQSSSSTSTGTLSMETECFIRVSGLGFLMRSGDFKVEPGASVDSYWEANIDGKFTMEDGNMYILNNSIRYGYLICSSDVEWIGGTCHVKVNASRNLDLSKRYYDAWKSKTKFKFPATSNTHLCPLPQNLAAAGLLADIYWTVIAATELSGTRRPDVVGQHASLFQVVSAINQFANRVDLTKA